MILTIELHCVSELCTRLVPRISFRSAVANAAKRCDCELIFFVRVQTPSCDGMGPQNNRHVGDGSYCQPEDYLSAAERAATLGI